RADELTLVQARASVEQDPNKAIAWLKTLSPEFIRWRAARIIAASAESHGMAKVFRGHAGVVNDLAFSRDGKTLASASDDRTIRLWNVETGRGTLLEGHTDEVWRLQFSPDGSILASGSKDRTLRLWNIATG